MLWAPKFERQRPCGAGKFLTAGFHVQPRRWRAPPHPGAPGAVHRAAGQTAARRPLELNARDPARGCRSAPPAGDPRPEPASPRAGRPETQGRTRVLKGCLPAPRQRQRWEKLDQLASPGGERSSPSASGTQRATRAQSRSQLFPGASEQLAGSWGERAAEGGSRAARGAGSPPPPPRTPRVPADVAVAVAVARLEEAPHPLLLAGAGRVAAAAAARAAAAAAARARRRRHHAPAPRSGGGRAAAGGLREAPGLLAAANLPGDGACPVAAGALRAGDSTSPGFAGAGKMGARRPRGKAP